MDSTQPGTINYQSDINFEKRIINTMNLAPNNIQVPPPAPLPKVTNLHVKMAKYATSLDSRGFIPVYEYMINSQPILWDRETGYVYWTGIWKALGREKGEIAKLVDADPAMSNIIKKIRGGFLKIQGTWIPFENARSLALLTCWPIREELAVIFGPSFIEEAVGPNHPRYIKPPTPSGEPKTRNLDSARKLKNPTVRKSKKNISTALLQSGSIKNRTQWNSSKNISLSSTSTKLTHPKFNSYNSAPLNRDGDWHHNNHNVKLPPLKLSNTDYFSLSTHSSYNQNYRMNSYTKHSNDSSSPLHTTPNSTDNTLGQISCSKDFIVDPKGLDEAINASLLLQMLSQDDGTPSSRKMFKAPSTFSIGEAEFRLVESKYRPVDMN